MRFLTYCEFWQVSLHSFNDLSNQVILLDVLKVKYKHIFKIDKWMTLFLLNEYMCNKNAPHAFTQRSILEREIK